MIFLGNFQSFCDIEINRKSLNARFVGTITNVDVYSKSRVGKACIIIYSFHTHTQKTNSQTKSVVIISLVNLHKHMPKCPPNQISTCSSSLISLCIPMYILISDQFTSITDIFLQGQSAVLVTKWDNKSIHDIDSSQKTAAKHHHHVTTRHITIL